MPTSAHARVYFSSDGGTTFVPATAPLPESFVALVANPSPSTFVLVRRNALLRSLDAGITWKVVKTLPSTVEWQQLIFVTSSHGEAIASNGQLFRTSDAGLQWSLVSFLAPGV